MSTTNGGDVGACAENRDSPEEIVDIIFRAILRRPPDKKGLASYSRMLRAGQSELEVIKRLLMSAEFAANMLVPASERLFRRTDDYDVETDEQISKYRTTDVRSMTERIQRRSLNYDVFDTEISRYPENEYVRFHKQRFYEIACAVGSLLEDHGSDALILDFGLSANSSVMRALFPSAKIAIADRPQIKVPRKEFHSTHAVDLEDRRLGEIDLGVRFDIIVFSEVIEHIRRNPTKVIRFLLKHLANDGYVILTTPNLFSRGKLRLISQRKSPLPAYPMDYSIADTYLHLREYTMKEMLSMIDEAGGNTRAFFFSGCWEDPVARNVMPNDELSNLFFLFQSKVRTG